MRSLIVALATVALISPTAIFAQNNSPPSREDVCDGLTGNAKGICNAYCEAQDCDADPSKPGCDTLRRNFQRATGSSVFPCDVAVTPTQTRSATFTPTVTFTPIFTATGTVEATATETPPPTNTLTPTNTATAIFTATGTVEATATETPPPTSTETEVPATFTPIFTATGTVEPTATETPPPDTATPTLTVTVGTSAPAGSVEEGNRKEEIGEVLAQFSPRNRNFSTTLLGANEVPPVVTDAEGKAMFRIRKDGDSIRFKLAVVDIEGVVQAHIHCGPEGVNGPVVAFLFGPEAGGITPETPKLASGTITAADVLPAPDSAACPGGIADFDDLIEKIRAGNTYTNVHTLANPGGEIRGQN